MAVAIMIMMMIITTDLLNGIKKSKKSYQSSVNSIIQGHIPIVYTYKRQLNRKI